MKYGYGLLVLLPLQLKVKKSFQEKEQTGSWLTNLHCVDYFRLERI